MSTVVRAAVVLGCLLVGCGGSDKEAKDPSQYDPEHVSDEQNQNEVDPFFEGEKSSRATEKVDLSEGSEGGDEKKE